MTTRTQRLPDLVADQIRKAIAQGEFPPGARLPPEKTMTARFGISRMVMREALSQLRADGLIDTRQGIGAFVRAAPGQGSFRLPPEGAGLDGTNLRHIFQLRIAVEGMAARLAARQADTDARAQLAAALATLAADVAAGRDGAGADQAFHAAVAEASGNPCLSQFLSYLGANLRETIRGARRNTARHHPHVVLAVEDEHRAILTAILARDPDAAEAAMIHHLSCAMTRLGIGPFCPDQD